MILFVIVFLILLTTFAVVLPILSILLTQYNNLLYYYSKDMTRCASRGAVGCDEERRGAHHSQAVDDVDEGGNSETQGLYGIFRFQRWYSAR